MRCESLTLKSEEENLICPMKVKERERERCRGGGRGEGKEEMWKKKRKGEGIEGRSKMGKSR